MNSTDIVLSPAEVVDVTRTKPQGDDSSQTMALIARLAMEPSLDSAKVDAMRALIEMKERMEDRLHRQLYNAAMVAAQAEMPRVTKDGLISHQPKEGKPAGIKSRFATLDRLDLEVRPIYQRHGFSISVPPSGEMIGGKLKYVGIVRHSAGHQEEYPMLLDPDTSGAKNVVQASGSSQAYARRYLLKGVFNIIEEGQDNDGETVEKITEQQADMLELLLRDTKSSLSRFLTWHNIENLRGLSVKVFLSTMEGLDQKRQKLAGVA